MKHKKRKGMGRVWLFPMLCCLALCLGFTETYAQQTVTGKVLDTEGKGIPMVNVLVKGTSKGVLTSDDGAYNIDVPANAVLIFSSIGFKDVEETVGARLLINQTMESSISKLDEVVVVGYGTQKKSDLTGGVTSLSSNKLDRIAATNVAQRLQGQIAGLTITTGNNAPGEGATIRVRGEKSLSGGNNPLIILDGIPFNGSITEVDQNSIDNISVLKDASSAAIYGARAANGVILITTKKGVVGKPVVKYNAYVGWQAAERLPDLMNGAENIQLLKDYRKDKGESDWDKPESWLWASLQDNYKSGTESDWLGEVFRTALQQEHQISLSGATDALNYYASVSYTDQEGIVRYTGYKKYATTINLSQKLGDWLKIGVNVQLNQRDQSQSSSITSIIDKSTISGMPSHAYAYRMSPYGSIRDANGKYSRYPMWSETMYYSPFANSDAVTDDVSRGVYSSAFAEIQLPIKGLTYRANLGNSYRQRKLGSYFGTTTLIGDPDKGKATVRNDDWGDWTWENLLLYKIEIKKHRLDLTGLYSAQKSFATKSEMSGKGFLSDANAYHNIGSAQGVKASASDKTESSMISYMGRLNYGFDSKYLLTVTFRRDGYSAFGPENKWATFPSVAGAWVATNEQFVKNLDLKALDMLKFRLSYGGNGNQAINAYETYSKMTQSDYVFGDGSQFAGGLVNGFTAGNKKLKWETTYSTNIGLDFSLWNGRITSSFDYYITNTRDLLMNRSVAIMNGYTTFKDNVGKTQNKGFDWMVQSNNIVLDNFRWQTALSLSGNWSKIKALREDGKDDVANKWFIGEPISANYDYRVDGIWQTSEAEEAKVYKAVPGDAKLYDKDGNGKIDPNDRMVIGSKLPIWTAGLTNTFFYKNWTLSVFLNGVFDVSKENETVKFERQLFGKSANYIRGIDYWTPERPSNEYTRLDYLSSLHSYYTQASYVRIQDINLSYQFPEKVLQYIGVKGLSTYINIKNVYTFSKAYKYTTNLDQSKYSLDASGYPTPRTFIFGLNLTF